MKKRYKPKVGKELLVVGIIGLIFAAVNFVLQRYTDGALCLVAGAILLLIWKVRSK